MENCTESYVVMFWESEKTVNRLLHPSMCKFFTCRSAPTASSFGNTPGVLELTEILMVSVDVDLYRIKGALNEGHG